MASTNTKIEWCDITWNCVRGCTPVSAGCTNCYASKMAARFCGTGQPYEGLAKGGKWTGKVRCIETALNEPMHWRKPARIFVNSMSDLFHADVPESFIWNVLQVVEQCPRHTFIILTKRPERMAAILHEWVTHPMHGRGEPLPNLWCLTSVEDQQAADERIPWLLKTPAVVRGVSCEPLIGPVSLRWPLWQPWETGQVHDEYDGLRRISWCIVGGESGPNARPMHIEWARSLRDECAAAGVPFHYKQHGEWAPVAPNGPDNTRNAPCVAWPALDYCQPTSYCHAMNEAYNGGTPCSVRVGKRAAGRLLDGVLHDSFPEVSR